MPTSAVKYELSAKTPWGYQLLKLLSHIKVSAEALASENDS
jgi:hypothetical protein